LEQGVEVGGDDGEAYNGEQVRKTRRVKLGVTNDLGTDEWQIFLD
jgi:hypothetical protein